MDAALASVQSGAPVIPCLAILDTATGRWRRPALAGWERGTRDLSKIHELFSSPEAASYLLGLRFADKGWVVENGGGKVCHGSGGIVPLLAE